MSVESESKASSDDSGLSARIDRLAVHTGVDVDQRQLHQLVVYLTALGRWNRTINLTSLDVDSFPDTTLARLIVEPLQATQMLSADVGPWYDLGSGGGSPALPLKVLRPLLSLTMVESKTRKAAFLREVARLMGLASVEVLSSRFADLMTSVPPQSARLVTVRAVRVDSSLTQVVHHLLAADGQLVAFGTDARLLTSTGFAPVRAHGAVTVLRRDVPRGTT